MTTTSGDDDTTPIAIIGFGEVGTLLARGFAALSRYPVTVFEMRESAITVAETGLEPYMATAIAKRQDAVADLVALEPALRDLPQTEWREVLDALARVANLRDPRTP